MGKPEYNVPDHNRKEAMIKVLRSDSWWDGRAIEVFQTYAYDILRSIDLMAAATKYGYKYNLFSSNMVRGTDPNLICISEQILGENIYDT